VDGNLCFESTKVRLPLGNKWGITAASAENPDSFEVFKLVTTTESYTPNTAPADYQPQQSHLGEIPHPNDQAGNVAAEKKDIPAYSGIDDNMVPPSKYHTSEEQFADLHDRMQAMMSFITALSRDLIGYQEMQHKWHDDLVTRISKTEADVNSLRILNDRMDGEHKEKLDTIHKDLRSQRADMHQALEQHVSVLRGAVLNTHHSLSGALDKVGGFHWGKWIGIVFGSQVVTAVLYMVYKKRKHGSPKKYL
jgi:mannose-binding lectin 1